MGFSTNYEDVKDNYEILPEGEYEVVIRNIEERTTRSGATGLNLSLIVRNDVKQENVKYVNATAFPDCKHVFKEKKQVSGDAVAQKPQESFAAAAPQQPENLSIGDLDGFEEIVDAGDVPF